MSTNKNFWSYLYGLQQTCTLCDVTLQVIGEDETPIGTVMVHGSILAASSKFFQTQLEVNDNLQKAYFLDGISPSALQTLVDYIYRKTTFETLKESGEAMHAAKVLQVFFHTDDLGASLSGHPSILYEESKPNMFLIDDHQPVKQNGKQLKLQKKKCNDSESAPGNDKRLINAPAQTDQSYLGVSTQTEESYPIQCIHTGSQATPSDFDFARSKEIQSFGTKAQKNLSGGISEKLQPDTLNEIIYTKDDNTEPAIIKIPHSSDDQNNEQIINNPSELPSGKEDKHLSETDEFTGKKTKKIKSIELSMNTMMENPKLTHKRKVGRPRKSAPKNSDSTVKNIIAEDCSNSKSPFDTLLEPSHEFVDGVRKSRRTKAVKQEVKDFLDSARSSMVDDTEGVSSDKDGNRSWFECFTCSKSFPSQQALHNHEKTYHQPDLPLTCISCQRSFTKKSELSKHLKLAHGGEKYPCDQCGILYKTRFSLESHLLKKHSGERNYQCPECPLKFFVKPELKSHIRFKHSDARPFSCKMCERTFKSKQILNRHMVTYHSNERKFQCEICDAKFKTNSDRRKHIRLHNRGKPIRKRAPPNSYPKGKIFQCSHCPKTFDAPKKLYQHEKLVHASRDDSMTYICTLCNKTFPVKHYLMVHIQAKHMPKRFQCSGCDMKFMYQVEMNRHLLPGRCKGIPNNQKPFVCDTCGMGFTLRGNLTKHIQHPDRCRNHLKKQDEYVVVIVKHENQYMAVPAQRPENEVVMLDPPQTAVDCTQEETLQATHFENMSQLEAAGYTIVNVESTTQGSNESLHFVDVGDPNTRLKDENLEEISVDAEKIAETESIVLQSQLQDLGGEMVYITLDDGSQQLVQILTDGNEDTSTTENLSITSQTVNQPSIETNTSHINESMEVGENETQPASVTDVMNPMDSNQSKGLEEGLAIYADVVNDN